MTATLTPVAGAVETRAVVSHLHPTGSFDVADHPVPNGREEVWRFTPLRRFAPLFEDRPTDDRADGDVAAAYDVPDSYVAAPLAPGQAPRGTVLTPIDRPSAIASANCAEALYLRIPADESVAQPLRVTVTGKGADRASNAHYVLEAGANSKATVVFRHQGSAQHSGNLEVIVGDGAELTVVSVQDWADDAIHAGLHEALIGRAATYRHIAVSFGGGVIRMHSNVRYAGVGGSAELLGLYFADAGQHIEHRLFVDHNNPRGESHVDYRGALQGEGARSVWIGDVLIRQNADDIVTYEANKNLVLSDGCRADSVPNLEIETGEIQGAGHSSTTGRFDDEQLFYLRSRGLSEEEARRLVVRGFFASIITKIGVPDVEEYLLATVERELEATVQS